MYKDFTATVVGPSFATTTFVTATTSDSGEIVLDIIAPPGCCDIYITKQQAMEFFGLVDPADQTLLTPT